MTLPTFQASVDRIFPFAPKDGVKKGFIKNVNFQYSIRGENRIRTTDSLFFKSEMFAILKTDFSIVYQSVLILRFLNSLVLQPVLIIMKSGISKQLKRLTTL